MRARPYLLTSLLSLTACVNGDFRFHEVAVEASISIAPEFDTPELRDGADVHFQAHLAVSNPGEGVLEHPLGEFERWVELAPDAGPVELAERTLLVPLHRGDGLVLYAFLDIDGDGVLCAPDSAPEPAGLIELTDFPTFDAQVELVLDQACKGPEALYP
jgi:hypothetical protein